jgi:ferredoxin
LGFFDIQDGGKNLATKLTWIVWWPGIIFTFVLVGRLWCVMCPFGTMNDWATKIAKPQRMFPRALRGLWLATLLFVILTWADEQLGIIRSPLMTAWLIILLSLAAVATGLFFQRRSFCRYLCPITGLQGLYSMMSPVELRSQDRSECGQGCRQDCYRGSEDAAGCPMFEFPMTLERNTFCNFCFECVKSCPKENLTLRLRSFGADLWASTKRYLDEAYLALALVGITTLVTAQMLSSWSDWTYQLSRLIPVSIRTLMKPITYLTLTESLVFFIGSLLVFPLLGYLAALFAKRALKDGAVENRKIFVGMAYMFIPIGLAMHLAHNLSHLLTEGQGVFPAFRHALAGYGFWTVGEPDWQAQPLASLDIVYALQMLLLLAGLIFSVVAGHRLAAKLFSRQEDGGRALVPFVLLAVFFTLINLYLLNQPMGMRHGM